MKAALLVIMGMTLISSNDVLMKLSSEHLGVGQLLFLRGSLAVVFFSILIKSTGRSLNPRVFMVRVNLLRASCECCATLMFITALSMLPLALVSTLTWTSPIFLTIAAALVLHERVSAGRWLAVCIGFVGVVLVTNPFSGEFSWIMILPLLAALFVCLRDLATRKVRTDLHSMYVIYMTLIVVTFVGGLIALFDWRTVDPGLLGWLGLSAALLSLGFLSQVNAVRLGELSFIAPFSFTGILVSVGYGYLVWGEIPSFAMFIGIALIIASGIYILTTQRRAAS